MKVRYRLAGAGLAVWWAGLAPQPVARAQEVDADMSPREYPLAQVRIGRQVYGPRLSKLDFENRVVVIYTWCITCPVATGGLAQMDELQEKYRDRGLAVAAFHCRREPWINEENIVHCCQESGVTIPVTRRGWVSPWPSVSLPWAAVYNHKGEMVYAGGLRKLESAVAAALKEAPDDILGGPYRHITALFTEMAADKQALGRGLPAVRRLASGATNAPAAEEAKAMLASIDRYVRNRFAKAAEEPRNVAARAAGLRELAERFEGDEIAALARRALVEIEASCNLAQEQEAYDQYQDAWAAFRALPPAGTYADSMDYTPTRTPLVLARRRRISTEFRTELKGIDECYPRTYAASLAIDDLTHYTPDPMDPEAVKARLRAAARLTGQAGSPLHIYEGLLQLEEILDGYPTTDALSKEALAIYGRARAGHETHLLQGRRAYDAAKRSMHELVTEVDRGGAELSNEDLLDRLSRLEKLATDAGAESYLAGQIDEHVARIRRALADRSLAGVTWAGTDEAGGVAVQNVLKGSAAAAAGLRDGDAVFNTAGRPCTGAVYAPLVPTRLVSRSVVPPLLPLRPSCSIPPPACLPPSTSSIPGTSPLNPEP